MDEVQSLEACSDGGRSAGVPPAGVPPAGVAWTEMALHQIEAHSAGVPPQGRSVEAKWQWAETWPAVV